MSEPKTIKYEMVMEEWNPQIQPFANFISYVNIDADGVLQHQVTIARKHCDELGWPKKITVTIEPGDTLNSDSGPVEATPGGG